MERQLITLVIIVLTFCPPVWARIGESLDACNKRYGSGQFWRADGGRYIAEYHKNSIRVKVTFLRNSSGGEWIAEGMFYKKQRPGTFTANDIETLISVNTRRGEWFNISEDADRYVFWRNYNAGLTATLDPSATVLFIMSDKLAGVLDEQQEKALQGF